MVHFWKFIFLYHCVLGTTSSAISSVYYEQISSYKARQQEKQYSFVCILTVINITLVKLHSGNLWILQFLKLGQVLLYSEETGDSNDVQVPSKGKGIPIKPAKVKITVTFKTNTYSMNTLEYKHYTDIFKLFTL